jgi:ACT domain-containing protein
MKGIITVVGKDRKGIIASVSGHLYQRNVNILDLSQTIVQGYFNMVMIIDLNGQHENFHDLADSLQKLGEEIGMLIKLQHEDIFNSMHRI